MDDRPSITVEAIGISKGFPGVLAVDGVDMALRPGEARALAGQNGSGKSTLIKVVSGVYRPDSGTVMVSGAPVDLRSTSEAVAAGISHHPSGGEPDPTALGRREPVLGPRTQAGAVHRSAQAGE